jgi:dephospho-CoA kinase
MRLEEIIFPLVAGEIERWLATEEVSKALLAVIELPMLFEAGLAGLFESVVLVTAPAELRKARHEGRIGLADFERRAARQLPEDEKRARSDFVYDNTGSPEELDEFIAGVIEKILEARGE